MGVNEAINYQSYDASANLGTTGAALGKYDLVYSHHDKEIKSALDAEGIKYNPADISDIQNKFLASSKAQDRVWNIRESDYRRGAESIVKKYPNVNVDKMMHLTHYLGNAGAMKYMDNVMQYGTEAADKIFLDEMKKKGGAAASNPAPSLSMQRFINRLQ